jgi:predicted SAM-dependent methyltransferase
VRGDRNPDLKLNLGCGARVVEGWVNTDRALGTRLAKLPLFARVNSRLKLTQVNWDRRIFVHDLTRRFPWPDSSATAVYSSHTLEHFTKEEGRTFLLECHRVLGENGILRIVVPDFRVMLTSYTEGRLRADDFVTGLGVLYESGGGALKRLLAPLIQFPHKCMYDVERLLEIMDEIGFTASSRAAFDSEIDDIHLLETEDRAATAIVVEGRKRSLPAASQQIPGAGDPHYPGNFNPGRGALSQEIRGVARPLKKGDLRGTLHALLIVPPNLWNHYVSAASAPRFLCSCCENPTWGFMHQSDHERVTWNASCPVCDSRSRHRGLAVLIPRILDARPDLLHILHFAPEAVLAGVLARFARLDYKTTDLDDAGYDFPGEDVQKLSFASGQYDLIVCNHVLEHVPDDAAALSELARILSADGLAIITAPCDWQKAETANSRVVPPGGHYRHYGRDIAALLARHFESVQAFDMHELDAAPNGLSYGIRPKEMAFLCGKRESISADSPLVAP